MAEEREFQLDQIVTTLDAEKLVTFAKHLKIDETDGLSKVRLIKAIRKQVEANLDELDDESKSGYLDGLINEINDIKEKSKAILKLKS